MADRRETIRELVAAGRAIMDLHDDLAARIEAGEDVDDAFERWDAAVDRLSAAVTNAEQLPEFADG